MTAATLLADLSAAGIRVTASGSRLHWTGPPGALTDALRQRLVAHKGELLGLLGANAPTESPPDLRTRLLALAADELLPRALALDLADADVAACTGVDDPTLRAYLHVLDREAGMARGIVPEGWEAVAHCDACGPIHWYAAERLKACAWCKHRRALRAIPRPRVRCCDCAHYRPDHVSPAAGMGLCSARDGVTRWARRLHRCPDMRPGEPQGD